MPSSPVQTPAARKAASSQQAMLEALVGSTGACIKDGLAGMAGRMAAALADLTQHDTDARDVYRRVKSARLLKDNAYAFVHLAGAAIDAALRAELGRLAPQPATPALPASALSLVPFEEIDDKLAFAALARPFDIAHSETLATLSVRLGMLLGRGVLRADSNPFRPDVFLRAIADAWREFEPDDDAHGLIEPLLRPDIVFDFAPLLDTLVADLRKGGQPGSVDAYRIQKTDDVAAAKAARAGHRAALAAQLRQLFGDDGGDDGVPLIPDLPQLAASGGAGGWRPSAAAGFQVVAPAGAAGVPAAATAAAGFAAGAPAQAGAVAAQPAAQGVAAAQPAPQGVIVGQPIQPGFVAGQPASPGFGAAQPTQSGPAPAQPMPQGFVAEQPMPQGFVAEQPMPVAATGTVAAVAAGGQVPAGAVPSVLGFTAPAHANTGAMQAYPGFAAMAAGGQPGNGPASTAGVNAAAGAAAVGNVAAWPAMVQGMLAQHGGTAPLLELLAGIEPALAAAPVPGAAADGAVVPHNVFYLPRLRQSLPKGSLPRGDERTLDLLARVFETVLQDDGIPARARDLLQVLQVPVLKAALHDKAFFFEDAHPARRLVDLLSRMGWEQRQDADDPLFQAMQRSVARVEGAAQPDAFASAVAELEASIAVEEGAQDAALAAPVATALRQEKLDVAGRAARDAIALRVGAGDVIDVVSGFLEQRWTTVLTFAYSIEDDKPGAVRNATRTMDDLIWSVKPKATQEQRKTLIARLPRLLATLNKWLDAIKWQDAERLQFFARLAEYHAAIVRAPIELSPERQLELAVEAAQRDAVRRVELENAAAERIAARAAEVSAVDGLERGMWLEFRTADGARKVKLAWVSPLRTLFIFSGAARREAFSMAADKLAAALHDGSARVLAIDGVVGQVLSEAMAQGAVNDAKGSGPEFALLGS